MNDITTMAKDILQQLDAELFRLGETPVTPMSLLIFIGTCVISVGLAGVLRRGLQRLIDNRHPDAEGLSYALGRMVQIVVVVLGVIISLETLGLSLTTLTAVGATLSVGLGLGLQSLAQNYVAGITLLVQRPVQKGDFIIVGDTVGMVDEISLRLTRVITRDGISILVPNSELVSTTVTNITRPTDLYRTRIDVGVAYGSDLQTVEACLLEVAEAHERVLEKPDPEVFFVGFGNSSLDFQLCVWIDDPHREPRITSDLRFAIDDSFRNHGVTIPFPQRDLHLKAS